MIKDIRSPWIFFSRASFWAVMWLGLNISFVEIFPTLFPDEWAGTRHLMWSANITWFVLIIFFELKISGYLQGKLGSHFKSIPRIIRKAAMLSVFFTGVSLLIVIACQFPPAIKIVFPEGYVETVQSVAFWACLLLGFTVRATSFVYHIEAESDEI